MWLWLQAECYLLFLYIIQMACFSKGCNSSQFFIAWKAGYNHPPPLDSRRQLIIKRPKTHVWCFYLVREALLYQAIPCRLFLYKEMLSPTALIWYASCFWWCENRKWVIVFGKKSKKRPYACMFIFAFGQNFLKLHNKNVNNYIQQKPQWVLQRNDLLLWILLGCV